MRIIILLNPTNKRGTKNEYTNFRNFLENTGFILLQPEVFMKVIKNRKATERLIIQIKKNLPSTGTIRLITLTEEKYANIVLFEEKENYQEKTVGNKSFVIL